MADGTDLDAALDELFATPPEGFTAARNALAKALKAEKRKAEADEVTALRKPGRLVWALNQLGLENDDALDPLLAAADDVRTGGGDDFREAVSDLRDAVGTAAAAAVKRLDPPRTTDRADLAQALLAIVADDDATADLADGRLVDVPAPDAFGLGLSAPAAPKAKAEPKPKAKPKPGPASAGAAERPPDQLAIKRAAKRQKEAAKEADAADRALARAEKALDAEAEALARADTELTEAKEVVAEAEAALADAKTQLETAVATAAEAVESQERAAVVLAEAQARADEAAGELEEATAASEELGG
jgi:hypothetical protein